MQKLLAVAFGTKESPTCWPPLYGITIPLTSPSLLLHLYGLHCVILLLALFNC